MNFPVILRMQTVLFCRHFAVVTILGLALEISSRTCAGASVIYDTTPYWGTIQGRLGGLGPGGSSTVAETFVAPAGPDVALNDFTFLVEPYPTQIPSLHLRAFVFAWSGPLTGQGGSATGAALYMSPSFVSNPGSTW